MGAEREFVVEAVVFDMDGTLVDSSELVQGVWATFAERHDVDLADVLVVSHGRRAADTIAHYLEPEAAREALAAVNAHEADAEVGVREIPGAAAFVASLDEADVAVATSAPHDLAILRLAQAGIRVPDVVVGADDVHEGKPSPEAYLRAAELLARDPSRILIFEDAEAGLQAALAAGAQVVVVGPHESPTTADLPRIPDYSAVRATRDPTGTYRITLGA
ncbi:HAD-IA family hydrolase [Herbiconiux liukaitaii]|uniref:HAD-IA family hydrolase n=1 Tax=Herbiconiux liukaitaii TaxID=3342799 RepID=UPI0035B6F43D